MQSSPSCSPQSEPWSWRVRGRWGKTATARRQAASEVLLDIDLNAQQLAAVDPALLLPGAVPLLVDETGPRSLGRNVATEAKFAGIALDVGDEGQPVDRETVTAYLDALERLMIVENVSPWSVDLRSRSRLRGPTASSFSPSVRWVLDLRFGFSTPRIPGSPPQTSAPAQ